MFMYVCINKSSFPASQTVPLDRDMTFSKRGHSYHSWGLNENGYHLMEQWHIIESH